MLNITEAAGLALKEFPEFEIQMGTLAFGFKPDRQPARRPRDELNVNMGFRGGSRPGD